MHDVVEDGVPSKAAYIGDAVYVIRHDHGIILRTGSHEYLNSDQQIVLENAVMQNLLKFLEQTNNGNK